MRYSNETLINAVTANATTNTAAIDARQVLCVSAQIVSTAAGTGTLKLQVSNDHFGNVGNPTNWSDVTSATVSITAAGVFYIQKTEICAEYARLVYTDTTALVQTITTVADTAGSLNSTYFLISTATVNYYCWMNVNSAGVDPMVAGRTGIEVALATAATANAVADGVAAALDSLAFTAPNPAANVITCTNEVVGPATVASDGVAPTGFSFAVTAPTGTVTAVLESKSF